MPSSIEVTGLTPGMLHTAIAQVWVSPFLQVALVADGEQGDTQDPGGWRRVAVTFTPSASSATITLARISGDGLAYLDLVTAVEGEDQGDPFDGNTEPRGTLNYGWAGAEDESQSVRQQTPAALTILDVTPTINGTNEYLVRVQSEDGATRETRAVIVTTERVWAYLSTGAQFDQIVRFSRRLATASVPSRERALVTLSNRRFPVALFGPGVTLAVPGSATVFSDHMKQETGDQGSSIKDIEEFLLTAERVCYRDPDHRIFGTVEGELVNRNGVSADFRYTVEQTS